MLSIKEALPVKPPEASDGHIRDSRNHSLLQSQENKKELNSNTLKLTVHALSSRGNDPRFWLPMVLRGT